MLVLYNRLLPPKGFRAINLFGLVLARPGEPLDKRTLNHERIHSAQMKELLWLPFYFIYILEWLLRLPLPGNAYRQVSFEREAYRHDSEPGYLAQRRHFAQWRGC